MERSCGSCGNMGRLALDPQGAAAHQRPCVWVVPASGARYWPSACELDVTAAALLPSVSQQAVLITQGLGHRGGKAVLGSARQAQLSCGHSDPLSPFASLPSHMLVSFLTCPPPGDHRSYTFWVLHSLWSCWFCLRTWSPVPGMQPCHGDEGPHREGSSALENHLPGLTVLQIRSSGERVQDQLWPCVALDTVVSVASGWDSARFWLSVYNAIDWLGSGQGPEAAGSCSGERRKVKHSTRKKGRGADLSVCLVETCEFSWHWGLIQVPKVGARLWVWVIWKVGIPCMNEKYQVQR